MKEVRTNLENEYGVVTAFVVDGKYYWELDGARYYVREEISQELYFAICRHVEEEE